MTTSVKIKISNIEKSGLGTIDFKNYSSGDRLARGLKMAGIMLAIAIGCVLIPMLHFVLVPLFLLLSIVMGLSAWMEKGVIVQGDVNCPSCQSNLALVGVSPSFPIENRCRNCQLSYRIEVLPIVL